MTAGTSWKQARQHTRIVREQIQALQSRTQSLSDQHGQVMCTARALLAETSRRQDVQEFVEQVRAHFRQR
jgi:hypothetical protein